MEVGFLSGSLPSSVVFNVAIELDTAGKYCNFISYAMMDLHIIITYIIGPGDVVFSPQRKRIRPGNRDTATISFTHRMDAISQETDETYTLTINIETRSFRVNDELITTLIVAIQDDDGKQVH